MCRLMLRIRATQKLSQLLRFQKSREWQLAETVYQFSCISARVNNQLRQLIYFKYLLLFQRSIMCIIGDQFQKRVKYFNIA